MVGSICSQYLHHFQGSLVLSVTLVTLQTASLEQKGALSQIMTQQAYLLSVPECEKKLNSTPAQTIFLIT